MIGLHPAADGTTRHERGPVPIALHAARDRFAGLIPARLTMFRDLRAALSVAADGHRELAEIGALCHKIAGVAETLGFARAGDLSGWLDGMIDRELASGAAAQDIWPQIDPVLVTLMDDLQRAVRP